MSFSTYITRPSGKIRFWLEVAGVEPVFVSGPISPTSLVSNRTQIQCLLVDSIDVGEQTLDLEKRRVVGGGFSCQLRDTPTRQLRSLFAARKRRATFLTGNLTKTATTATVKSGTPVTNPMYIGAEALAYTTKVGTNISGITRGSYGSKAAKHYGGSNDGAGVYTVPPSWKGRQCWLKAAYIGDRSVVRTSNASEVGTIGSFFLSDSPQLVDTDLWSLTGDDPMKKFSDLRVYVGLRECPPIPGFEDFLDAVSTGLSIAPDDLFFFKEATNSFAWPTTVLVTFAQSGARGTFPIDSVGSTLILKPFDGQIQPHYAQFEPLQDDEDGLSQPWTTAKHIAIFGGDPLTVLLSILLSKTGDGSNHAVYDCLPGTERTEFRGQEWRMGAGLDAADIDVASFARVQGAGVLPMWVCLDRETPASELMDAFTLSTRSFYYTDGSFRLAVDKLRDRVPPSTAAQNLIVNSDVLRAMQEDNLKIDESQIFHRGTIRANWDPLQNKFLAEFNVMAWEIAEKYPDSAGERVIESKLLSVDVRSWLPDIASAQHLVRTNPAGFPAIEMAITRMQQNSARPRALYRAEVSWEAIQLRVGQVVLVTQPRIPDLEGSTLSSKTFRIVGRRPDVGAGTVHLTLQMLDDGFLVAPANTINGGWDAVAHSFSLYPTDPWDTTSGQPTDNWAVGWKVWIVDTTGVATWVFEERTIASLTAGTDTMALDANPAFTPAVGDLVLLKKDAAQTTANASGYVPSDYLFMNNDDATDETGAETSIRWS